MRLMLGHDDRPSLLVEVDDQDYLNSDFEFRVVNGCWYGIYNMLLQSVYVKETEQTIEGVEIITSNQDRLRGNCQDVFYNFDNPDYVALPKKIELPADWDDDIAF